MSQKTRNQHYLPQFFLRKFSIQNNGNQIGLYNIENEFFFPNAGIKNQGSKNFFYGKEVNLKISAIRIKSDALKMNFNGKKLEVHMRPHAIRYREYDRIKNQQKKQS